MCSRPSSAAVRRAQRPRRTAAPHQRATQRGQLAIGLRRPLAGPGPARMPAAFLLPDRIHAFAMNITHEKRAI